MHVNIVTNLKNNIESSVTDKENVTNSVILLQSINGVICLKHGKNCLNHIHNYVQYCTYYWTHLYTFYQCKYNTCSNLFINNEFCYIYLTKLLILTTFIVDLKSCLIGEEESFFSDPNVHFHSMYELYRTTKKDVSCKLYHVIFTSSIIF